MRTFVFDEWLWADLSGEKGQDAQRESFMLLKSIFEKCDRMVAVRGSPFLRKFYNLAGKTNIGDPRRAIIKFFKVQFLENSEKLCLLQEDELSEIPKEIEHKVKEDDKYLVRAYLATQADLLVTSDNPLMKALCDSRIRFLDRASFVSEYIKGE
jgi:hypothetical protein